MSIGTNGGVTITWDRNGLNGSVFQSYGIFYSNSSSGPFAAVDSVFLFNDSVATHTGASALSTPAWYFIQFRPNDGSAPLYSDTVRALQLSVLNPGSGFANLAWNQMQLPPAPTAGAYFHIWREWPRGIFVLIDSVTLSGAPNPVLYSDLISICNDSINYRIELMDAGGCVSVSNLDGDLFRDLQPPPQPVLDSVSVNATGTVDVGWPASVSPDAVAYVLLQGVGSIWTPIDTNFGRTNTFSATTVSGSSQPVSFQIVAVDSCGNPSSQSASHTTMYLQGVFLECEKAVALTWNPYTSWGSPVTYEVLRSALGGLFSLQAVVSDPQYYDTLLTAGVTYCYAIRARHVPTNRTATSSTFCITPDFSPAPNLCSIRSVSVAGPGLIRVIAAVDPVAAVSGYELLRSNFPTGPFVTVATINGSGSPTITFQNNAPFTDDRVYYYQVITIDSCGLNALGSQVSKSILLKGNSGMDAINTLHWTDYSDWPTGVDRYNVYRKINGITEPVPIAVIQPGNSFSISDTVIDDYFSDGTFCYVVEAIEAIGNPNFFTDSARSNEVCLVQEPGVYVPNAFHPGGGINEVFRPYPVFLSREDYSFAVYNRWGGVVFTTDNIEAGWDGTVDGASCQEAVYVYRIQARKTDGTLFEKVGSVTLIR
ncbi:MAG: gliding motility-associated C-terminal domain-containing protein [Bacteroidota bacterium]